MSEDPWLWLEEVEGTAALAWVRERNAESESALVADPRYATLRAELLEVLDSTAQIPHVARRGGFLYNFWRDAAQPRGLWRRTTLDDYRQAEPAWETLIDLDALAAAEGENWVWKGATTLPPLHDRALVQLSRGGADAVVVREFDLSRKRFVDDGFALPEAKTRLAWDDADAVFVGTDFGPGTATDSGYPRVIRRWRRGTPLAAADTVFEAERSDVSAWVAVDPTPGFRRVLFGRALDFYRDELFLFDGTPRRLTKPDDAMVDFWRDRALMLLRSDATFDGRAFPRGALLVGAAEAVLGGPPRFEALFTPTARCSLDSFTVTRDAVLLTLLDDVTSRIEEWTWAEGRWQRREVAAGSGGTLSVASLHDPCAEPDPLAEAYLVTRSGFLEPDTLALGQVGSDRFETLKQLPSFFAADGMTVAQHFARSKDGTAVPYFVVRSGTAPAPTLLYGYGGFEVPLQPSYSGLRGRGWLARGGTFVLANLRGGGEYGPAWHQAALREKRQNAFDDFIAVAEDLIARGIARPAQLGIMGGSNGGLLVGAVMLQRPELFGAVVCQVPLLDMRRYHRLLAGASWMAEYGNPDEAADWEFISRYSPYQNLRAGITLPPVLLTTSTRDDRVHPGHARKFAARLRELGHQVLYWENLEGGHAGAADNGQAATMRALELTFLWQQLASGC